MKLLFWRKHALAEKTQIATALEAAAYMRWVEARQQKSPTDEAVDLYIRGVLDGERAKATADDVKATAILALTMNIDLVSSYIGATKFFERLDDAMKRGTGADATASAEIDGGAAGPRVLTACRTRAQLPRR